MNLSSTRLRGDKFLKEGHEFRAGVTLDRLAVDFTAQRIQGGVQRERPVTVVLRPVPLHPSRAQGQDRVKAVQGLDVALLIKAEHGRVLQRVQVQTDDVGRLVLEVRIVRRHVPRQTVGLEPRPSPDLRHGHVGDTELPSHLSRGPVRRAVRRRLSSHRKHARFHPRRDHPGPRRARLILMLAAGKSYREIQTELGCASTYVSRWKARFQERTQPLSVPCQQDTRRPSDVGVESHPYAAAPPARVASGRRLRGRRHPGSRRSSGLAPAGPRPWAHGRLRDPHLAWIGATARRRGSRSRRPVPGGGVAARARRRGQVARASAPASPPAPRLRTPRDRGRAGRRGRPGDTRSRGRASRDEPWSQQPGPPRSGPPLRASPGASADPAPHGCSRPEGAPARGRPLPPRFPAPAPPAHERLLLSTGGRPRAPETERTARPALPDRPDRSWCASGENPGPAHDPDKG